MTWVSFTPVHGFSPAHSAPTATLRVRGHDPSYRVISYTELWGTRCSWAWGHMVQKWSEAELWGKPAARRPETDHKQHAGEFTDQSLTNHWPVTDQLLTCHWPVSSCIYHTHIYSLNYSLHTHPKHQQSFNSPAPVCVFSVLQVSDGGVYTCKVSNPAGQLERMFTLTAREFNREIGTFSC